MKLIREAKKTTFRTWGERSMSISPPPDFWVRFLQIWRFMALDQSLSKSWISMNIQKQNQSWFQWAPRSMNLFPKNGHGFLRPQTHPRNPRTEFLLLLLPPLFLVGFHCEYLLKCPPNKNVVRKPSSPVDEFSNGRKSSIAMLDRG